MSRNSTFAVGGVSRVNQIKPLIYGIFYYYSSYARLIIETFIRSGFGERYYNLSSLLIVTMVLLMIPIRFISVSVGSENESIEFLKSYTTWYIFVGVLVWRGLKHVRVINAEKKTFEYGRLSTFSGYFNPIFQDIKIKGKKATMRQIECFLEPAGFFIAGLILLLCGQGLGVLFLVCSIIYAVSYWAEYEAGTQMILNYIDDMIWRKHIEESFVEDKSIYELAGVGIRGEKPSSKVTRKEVFDHATKNDDPVDVK